MPIYPYSFQLPPLNVQDIPNDGAPGEFLGINVGGALDWLPAGGGGGSGDMLAANNLSELTNFATARTNIGLGTASTPTFANLTLTSPSLASSAPVTISQTWNAGSNVMTALKVVATDTASGATSNLLELWAGSTPALDFAVTKAGVMQAYGTYSSAGENYARLALACDSSGNATISTQALGTGTAGVLAFSPGNSERMRITTAGNVGIGTTAPGAKLEIVESTSNVAGLVLRTTTVGSPRFEFIDGAATPNKWSFGCGAASAIDGKFFIYDARQLVHRFAIDTAGNVGIGTTSPTSKLHVAGTITVSDIYPAPNVCVSANDGFNIHADGTGVTVSGVQLAAWTTNEGAWINSAYPLCWGTSRGTKDTVIQRDGEADHLAMRRSTNGQKFSVYGTYPGANWERFTITAPTSGNVLLGTYKGTGGIARGLEFQTDGVTRMTIPATTGTVNFPNGISSAAGATSVFQNANAIVFSLTGGTYNGTSTVGFFSPSDGVLRITNNAVTDFNRIQLGGTTDAFPAIARDGAGIKFTGAAAGATAWIKVPPVVVSALPLAATAGAGARAFVNDALAPTFGNAVTGGGAVLVPVYSDGSAWNVG